MVSLISEGYLLKIQNFGRNVGAEYGLVINGRLRQYYKKGDSVSKNCPYFMGDKQIWQNSCNSSLATTFAAYRMTHESVEVIKIESQCLLDNDSE